MKRIAILGLAAAALLAVGVTGAFGKAPGLTLSTKKGPLAKGAELKAVSANVVTKTSKGSLECGEDILNWTLSTNGSSKDKGSIVSGENKGGGKNANECKSSIGSVKFTDLKLPWALQLSSKGTGEIKKSVIEAEFTELAGAKCTYEGKKARLIFATSGALVLKVAESKYKVVKGSNAACPAEGKLNGEFVVTSGGETVEV